MKAIKLNFRSIDTTAFTVLTLVIANVLSSASAFSPPPEWDPMLMLNVTLDKNNQLAVETTPDVIPLTVAPGSYNSTNKTYNLAAVAFDPSQPYAVLNGAAYSRALGWYDQGTTGANGDSFYDTYASQLNGHYVWIEKTGGSPELKTYFVNEDVTGDPGSPYTPMFGADGSSTKWRWDGFMDHNTYAVALKYLTVSRQLFSANYHLYIGDANGNPVSGYGDATTTWRWRGPALAVVPAPGIAADGSQIVVSWAPTVTNLTLVSVNSLAETNWIALTNAPVLSNGNSTVSFESSSPVKFFQLQLNP